LPKAHARKVIGCESQKLFDNVGVEQIRVWKIKGKILFNLTSQHAPKGVG